MRMSPKKIFLWTLGIQIAFCALVILTTIWTFEIYRYAMIPYLPFAYLWEQFVPWGRDRDQIVIAMTLWIPLIGCMVYSGIAYVIAISAKDNKRNHPSEPKASSGSGAP